jgi:hypothetical protein
MYVYDMYVCISHTHMYVCVCICICIYIYMLYYNLYITKHTFVHRFCVCVVRVCMHVCTHVRKIPIASYKRTCGNWCVRVHAYHTHAHNTHWSRLGCQLRRRRGLCMYVSMYVCMYACMYAKFQ